MSTTIEEGDSRIDRASQRMLRGLVGDDSRTTSELREVADLSQNNQVIYRMEEHLLPAGLVEELPRGTRWGSGSGARQFVLSKTGRRWISEHEEEMGGVVTVEEMRVGVREAMEVAESARSSVQSYRRKVSRLKGRVEEAEETVEEARRRIAREDSHDEAAREEAKRAWNRAGSISRDVDYIEGELEEIDERVGGLAERGETMEDRLGRVEGKVDRLVRERAEVERAGERGLFARLFGR